MKSVLKDPVFKEEFLDSEYENAVSAFARKNAEDALKTAPKVSPWSDCGDVFMPLGGETR